MHLTYQQIRDFVSRPKQTHCDYVSDVHNYGEFAIVDVKGGYAIVDSDIAQQIKHKRWRFDTYGYIKTDVAQDRNKSVVRLHDYVMATRYENKPEGSYVDHINGCKYDNRYSNLRIVTPSNNMRNVRMRSNNTSGICGVAKSRNGKWRAYISFDQRQHSLGVYKNKSEAIAARYCAEEKLGFPHTRDMEDYISSVGGKMFEVLESRNLLMENKIKQGL